MLHLYVAAFGAVVAANIIADIAIGATISVTVIGRYGYGQMGAEAKKPPLKKLKSHLLRWL